MKLLIIFALIFFVGCGRDSAKLPKQYIDDRENMTKSFSAFKEANDLNQPPDKNTISFKMSVRDEKEMYSLIKEGIALSEKVDDEFLDYLHPQLKFYYRNKLVEANRLFYEGSLEAKIIDSPSSRAGILKQLKANKLLEEWWTWWELNRDNVYRRAFPD